MSGVICKVQDDVYEVTYFMGGYDKFDYMTKSQVQAFMSHVKSNGGNLSGFVCIAGMNMIKFNM